MRRNQKGVSMAQLITSGFEEGDDDLALQILSRWDGGPISVPLFTRLAGMLPQPVVEMVIFRVSPTSEYLEVLLIERPEGDPVWPGMVHTPGTALRRSDFDHPEGPLAPAFARLRGVGGESGLEFSEPRFVTVLNRVSKRGADVGQIFYTMVEGDPPLQSGAFWAKADELWRVDNLIENHAQHVGLALVAYVEHGM